MQIELKKYGILLSGREFGKQVYLKISKDLSGEKLVLNFKGVIGMGSSFGDEVVPPLAKLQGGEIKVLNANAVITRALQDVAKDGQISLTIEMTD